MHISYRYVFAIMWIGWALYWMALSFKVKTAIRREPMHARLLHIVPLVLAGLLLSVQGTRVPVLDQRFVAPAEWQFWLGAALTAAGLLFTVWARLCLGRNWSGIVTIKEGHEFIAHGPYAFVRHPIYTGLILAFFGSAVAIGEWRGVLAAALAWWAFWRKLQLEESWMREQFGDAYQAYCRRVAALIPFIL